MLRRSVAPILVGLVSSTAAPSPTASAAGPRGYDGPRDAAASDADVPEAATTPARDDDDDDTTPSEDEADEPAPREDPDAAVEPDPPAEPEAEAEAEADDAEAGAKLRLGASDPEGLPTRESWLPRHSLIYRNFFAGRINPLGLVNELTLGYRAQLVARDTPLWRESYALVAAHGYLTPAFARIGPLLELQPLAVLNLGVGYDFVGAFGNLSQLTSLPSATDAWGPDELTRSTKAGLNYSTTGHLVTISGLLQGRVKNIALRSATRALWGDMRLRDGDRVYYDQAFDIPMPDRGWTIINETDLIYMFDEGKARGLRIAIRHSVTQALYRRRHFDPVEPVSTPNGPTLRLGPAAGYVFFDRPGARFNRPMVFVLSQWWLRHRYRTGEQKHVAVPYFAIGLQFDGEIWPYRKQPARGRRR
jgi:hypothetical protein